MDIRERAALVLQQIKKRREVIARSTKGRWLHDNRGTIYVTETLVVIEDLGIRDCDMLFIVASHAERDTELACLAVAIEGLLPALEPSEYNAYTYRLKRQIEDAATALCKQWEDSLK